jgi:hypothetical protein
MLRKKRARDGKASGEVEHFPVPASITVRQRSHVSIDMKESEVRDFFSFELPLLTNLVRCLITRLVLIIYAH